MLRLLLAFALAFSPCVEGGGVMLVSARQIFLGGKKALTARNYVSQGLVTMYDGIENAGWGIHSTGTLYSWADLAGGYPASIVNGAMAHDDYLDFSTNAAVAVPSNEHDALNGRTGPFTLEMVLSFPSKAPMTLFAAAAKDYDRNVFCAVRKSSGNVQISLPKSRVNISWLTLGPTFPSGVQHIVITNNGSASVSVTMNGESVSVPNTSYSNSSVITSFGNTTPSTANVGAGVPKYHAARLYSRVLSTAELAANYAIDKARFNLT